MSRLAQTLQNAYAWDLRSLGLLRIVCGLLFLAVRLGNWQFVEEFYSDAGSFPRSQLVALGDPIRSQAFSLFLVVGSPLGVHLLYALAIAAGIALTLGWRTRLATFFCWLLSLSLIRRNPFLNPGSDMQLTLCLFFGFFLPWGKVWSLDSRSSPSQFKAPSYSSAATLGWRIQILALYVGAGFGKMSDHWVNGTAVEVALRSDYWSRPLGQQLGIWLASWPGLLENLTLAVSWVEFTLPWLLFLPWARLQMLGVVLLCGLHLAFGTFLHLEFFSLIGCGCLVAFWPAFVWTRLGWLEGFLDRLFGGTPKVSEQTLNSLGPLASAFLTWSVLMILWSNAHSSRRAPWTLNPRALSVLQSVGLAQGWRMFVPPPAKGGWYTFRGRTAGGRWVDLISGQELEQELAAPQRTSDTLPSTRHYLFYNARMRKGESFLPGIEATALHFRRRWEAHHPALEDELVEVELYRFYREYLPGQGFTGAERWNLYQKQVLGGV